MFVTSIPVLVDSISYSAHPVADPPALCSPRKFGYHYKRWLHTKMKYYLVLSGPHDFITDLGPEEANLMQSVPIPNTSGGKCQVFHGCKHFG
jgi:hypothetical protein